MTNAFQLLAYGFCLGVAAAVIGISLLIRYVIVDGENHKKSCREHLE